MSFEQLEQQRDLLAAKMREGPGVATPKEIRTHRALTDFLHRKINRAQLAKWLARIESGQDLHS
jgi:hypothetical protein